MHVQNHQAYIICEVVLDGLAGAVEGSGKAAAVARAEPSADVSPPGQDAAVLNPNSEIEHIKSHNEIPRRA